MARIELTYYDVEAAIIDFLKKEHEWTVDSDQIQSGIEVETVEVSEYVYKKNKEGREIVDLEKTAENTHKESLFFNGHSKMSFYVEGKAKK